MFCVLLVRNFVSDATVEGELGKRNQNVKENDQRPLSVEKIA